MIRKEQEQCLRSDVEKILRQEEIYLFELRVVPRGAAFLVRIRADHLSGGITIDECARCNRIIRFYLEEKGFLGQDFELEVSSPGLDTKLKTPFDFQRVRGKTVSLWLSEPWQGKDYIEGVVEKNDENSVTLQGKGDFSLGMIKCAKQRM